MLLRAGMNRTTAGVDEAGRGPIAGPVFAAAVILDDDMVIDGLTDSKRLSAKKREQLFEVILSQSRAYGIAFASVDEIDQLNIRQASLLAMRRAVEQLSIPPDLVQVDGCDAPEWQYETQTIVKGDLTHSCISAASILAKVSRDRVMHDLHQQYPMYAFDRHMGYPTRLHLEKLTAFGPIVYHRKTFAPIKKLIIGRQNT
tara:strand:- start:158 stop:757 length:600 start_codon:yes stop_codon:yes gene_type:complete